MEQVMPTLPQLIEKFVEVRDKRKALAAEDKPLKEIQDGLELLMMEVMETDSAGLVLPDGSKANVTRKNKETLRIEASRSDEFYEWVKAHNRIDLLTRAIKQEALTAEVKANGLPPAIYAHTEQVVSVTVTRAAPKL
jgi:hypothetical protein